MAQDDRERGGQKRAFISSTSIDLPEHRKQVIEACLRMGYHPVGMEHWPAQDADAETVCLRAVDRADLFIGVYAFRYGWVPPGHAVSITELEYQRAVDKKKPRLLFFMDEDYPLPPRLVEKGEGGKKLEAFKKRVGTERVGSFFTTENDLRGLVVQALAAHRETVPPERERAGSPIPAIPQPYVAHPYTLLQSRRLVGRDRELSLLTDWVAKPMSEVYASPVLNFIAIGGMGKSALTWHFFQVIAPQEMRPLAGRLWWSFYERDAGFERFLPHALAYCSGEPLAEVERLDPETQQERLWQLLDQRPFLLVLDGLERILVAYNRLDAPRLLDDELDEATVNRVADAGGLPPGSGETYLARHHLRACTDPRAGRFLQRLTRLRTSRILVSSRLYPAEIQTRTGSPLAGSTVVFQQGLEPADALALWRELGVRGARDELLPLFESFGYHPLLLQALAGEVADFRPAPGDFAAWRAAHPAFDPGALPLAQRHHHILEHALGGLAEASRRVLYTLAGFRMPTGYATLRALLVGEGAPCADEAALDRTLTELEDRGLVGWERRSNRYDLHPIVRAVIWAALPEGDRRAVLEELHDYFRAQPLVKDWRKEESLADLEPAIELYDKLVGLGRYQEAFELFRDRLDDATLYRLSAAPRRLELLRALFPDGEEAPPRLEKAEDQGWTLNAMAQAYQFSGQPGAAVGLFRQGATIAEREGNKRNLGVGLRNVSDAQRLSGGLHGAERAARGSLVLTRQPGEAFREAVSLQRLGTALAARGEGGAAARALIRSSRLQEARDNRQGEGVVAAYRAELALSQGRATEARDLAERARALAGVWRHEHDFIRTARLQGAAALLLDDLATAAERLHHALQRARTVELAEEELPVLVALAELHRRCGEPQIARELLEQVWEPAERGPYPLFHADALVVLAQIERDAGNTPGAIAAATRAFQLAWCDGPPYAYHWGLEAARAHLKALGAPEPELPPFDPTAHEPMPEVEIEP